MHTFLMVILPLLVVPLVVALIAVALRPSRKPDVMQQVVGDGPSAIPAFDDECCRQWSWGDGHCALCPYSPADKQQSRGAS